MTDQLSVFPLKPWDRDRPHLHPRRADAVVRVDGRAFGLRVENGLLFFRESGDETRTFAATRPLDELQGATAHDAELLQIAFEEAWASGNVGRDLLYPYRGCFDRDFPLVFGNDGTGFCREAWNRDNIAFSWRNEPEWAATIWQLDEEDFLRIGERLIWPQVIEPLQELQFGDEVNFRDEEERVEWLCGSRDGLEQLVRWICWSEPGLFADNKGISITFQADSAYARAGLVELETARGELWIHYGSAGEDGSYRPGDVPHLRANRFRPLEVSPRLVTLFDLALDENTPSGVYWEYHDVLSGRASNSPWPLCVTFEIEPPSPSERLEARRQLEAWLQNVVGADERSQLLP